MKKLSYVDHSEEWLSEFSFYIPIKVRFSETDMFGHMNNTAPFIYFEEARIEFLKSVGMFGDVSSKAESVPVVGDLQCDFHQQIYFDDQLRLYVKVESMGRTSYDVHYLAKNQHDHVCLTGRGRIVHINPQTGKPVEITQEIKEQLTTV
ncbi:thioesterase family protein [Pontibacillus sp. HMF3514]|uniref:acyl-CoA thioesterase n=1 Tax=Pontibacillus sp. HMF3514 TaxID=2692425 RepID=UPI00131FDEED|nr:thioesterase family protein [Pontibacillus sp. HMF3514]QHE53180.1 acyl-CoA thioesterase [Pontibacillus sp. HMF3514]